MHNMWKIGISPRMVVITRASTHTEIKYREYLIKVLNIEKNQLGFIYIQANSKQWYENRWNIKIMGSN